MNILHGDKAASFVAWLSCAKGFLPKSMTLEEACEIFLRKLEDEKEEKDGKKAD